MTPRERFLTALNHEEPDREPQPDISPDNITAMYGEGAKFGTYPIE